MNDAYDVLIIGAGIAGMEASLLLSKAGKKVYLVEKLPLIGGNIIKSEESYPNLECATCMVAPMQQEILQDANIEVMTLTTIKKVEGEAGDFQVTVHRKPRYVSLTDCIGCGMCYEPCPVTLINSWEENLANKKAIYVPCTGALPNVPVIDPEHCLQLNGKKDCKACQEACMFGAIDFSDKAGDVKIQAGAILVATGFQTEDPGRFSNLGHGQLPGVYTAMEFERLFASNGPTLGELTLRGDEKKHPKTVAVVHCVGRKDQGYCSTVCCMSAFKHTHFIQHKLPDAQIYHFYSDLCLPGKLSQKFFNRVKKEGVHLVFQSNPDEIELSAQGESIKIAYPGQAGKKETLSVDMVILATAMIPDESVSKLAGILKIEQDAFGFFKTQSEKMDATATSRAGIFVAGCAEGPKDGQQSVIQAQSAVSHVMNSMQIAETV